MGVIAVDLAGLSIQIVDDNMHMRQLIRVMLEAAGVAEIREAESGEQAWEMLQSWTPDLVLSDFMMPGMDGMELTEKIRGEDGALGRMPVIIVTGHGETANLRRAVAVGANDFIVKPFTAGVLLGRVTRCLRDPRTIAEMVETQSSFG